jgi:hypothetical protein
MSTKDDQRREPQRPPEVPRQYRHELVHDHPVQAAPVQEVVATRRGGIIDWLSLIVWDVLTRAIAWSGPTGPSAPRPTPTALAAEPNVSRDRRSYGLRRLRRAHVVVILVPLAFGGGWVARGGWDAPGRHGNTIAPAPSVNRWRPIQTLASVGSLISTLPYRFAGSTGASGGLACAGRGSSNPGSIAVVYDPIFIRRW